MKFFKKYLPDHHSIKKSGHLNWIKHWLADPQIWQFNRRSVAKGTAVGLFFAVIPLPFQMLLSAIFSILMRANVPVAIVMTWITNPFTMLPMMYFIYKVGALITGDTSPAPSVKEFTATTTDPVLLWQHFEHWLASLGKNFFIGVPIVAIGFAVLGYLLIHIIWRSYVFFHLHFRRRRRS